jgi:hypothetical protein
MDTIYTHLPAQREKHRPTAGHPHALLQPAAITVMSVAMCHRAPFVSLTVDASASGPARASGLLLLLRLSRP